MSKIDEKRNNNYISFDVQQPTHKRDKLEDVLDEYFESILSGDYNGKCPLEFWKVNEQKFKPLAMLANKYLGIPASSAAVERIFSISGHILSSKRSRMSVRLFSLLVFLKLNEQFI